MPRKKGLRIVLTKESSALTSALSRTVLVCQGHTCKSSGSAAVLKAFQAYSIPDVRVIGSGCLAQCGNGPMVLILPEEIWYDQVSRQKVKILVEQHLLKGQPVGSMLYRVKHPLGEFHK
ncbi:MAG: (2Fe-2S) ferredoxin domain-containing protein [Xenococcaceae cyanobacterium MO_234.B1]|nr:(2Fe-2S) ferredoxin domain-containing protein [Xenococcaceae cyanobacterium MO_234.B1]